MLRYVLNKNTGVCGDVGGNTIGDRWIGQVSISEYFSSVAFSQLFMASFALPIKCLACYNKALTTVLLCMGKIITKT